MAKISFDGMPEIEKILLKEQERVQRNGEAALMAGAKVAQEALMAAVPVSQRSDHNGHHLRESIIIGEIKKSTMEGMSVEVGPDGYRPDGEPYAKVGFILEYGTSKHRAQPWMRPSMKKATKAIQDAMIEELMKD